MPAKPEFFRSASAFRAWLKRHHAEHGELWVGFHKKSARSPSMTWEESVDVALCFGWIDGVRKSAGERRYVIRFSRRRPRSVWSARNIARVRELAKQGLMEPAGLAAFRRLESDRSAVYSYEQRRNARLASVHERRFRARGKAWEFFQAQAPSYQRVASWWVLSAKKEETRLRRLERLIDASGHGQTILAVPRPAKPIWKARGPALATCSEGRRKAPA
ncbi:MAG TPA: YdeI/OmpD-associated family protein [Opitutaceae bacterium]|nr:YdeI/OmpD-associated family protein [Opitutaceae bacterium]